MPTLPADPPPQPEPAPRPHEARGMAESFGANAERYDRARAPYPGALVARVVAASPGPDFLDVGCGTGIASRQFAAAGRAVLGVDPDARMAEFARRTGVEVEVATFEEWDPAGRTFDAVVSGQAWHWVDPVAGAAKAARVLRPGGLLAAFAHVYDAPPSVAAALRSAMRRVVPDSPFYRAPSPGTAKETYQRMFAMFADGMRQADGLGDPEQWEFGWERYYTREQWLELMPTTGGLTRLPPDALAGVLEEVGTAVDAIGGGFKMPFTTLAATATTR